MDRIRVVNASPLITLAKVGRLDLLSARDVRMVIPNAVAEEVLAGPQEDPARIALSKGFGAPYPPAPVDLDVLGWSLGSGETAVLSLARSCQAVAVLDDKEARAAAAVLGIRLSGTLGIVVQAAREGRVHSAAALLRDLREVGLRLDDSTIAKALASGLGESWSRRSEGEGD